MQIKTIDLNVLEPSPQKTDYKGRDNKFSLLLNNALNKVNQLQIESDEYKNLLATGDLDNLHDVTIAAEKANISLQLTLGIRNKVIEAYREIMRIQI